MHPSSSSFRPRRLHPAEGNPQARRSRAGHARHRGRRRLLFQAQLSNAFATGRTAAALASAARRRWRPTRSNGADAHPRHAIDTQGRRIRTATAELEYSQLVLALGADPFPHGLAGSGAADVLMVNDLADYAAFRSAIDGKKRITCLAAASSAASSPTTWCMPDSRSTWCTSATGPGAPAAGGSRSAAGRQPRALGWPGIWAHRKKRRAHDGGYKVTLDNGETVEADVSCRQSASGPAPCWRRRPALRSGAASRQCAAGNQCANVYAMATVRGRRPQPALRAAADGAGTRTCRHAYGCADARGYAPMR